MKKGNKKTISFSSTGLVFGNYWGGGRGAYSAKPLRAETESELIQQAKKGLDGSLDAGMGYESLIGALLKITKTTTVVIDRKKFVNTEERITFIGDLKKSDKTFLLQCYSNR